MDNISCCGSDCFKCYCYPTMCQGCNICKGKVFHSKNGCPIYECAIHTKHLKNCAECPLLPCDIWKKTRYLKFSDEEFEKNIQERISLLKDKNNKVTS